MKKLLLIIFILPFFVNSCNEKNSLKYIEIKNEIFNIGVNHLDERVIIEDSNITDQKIKDLMQYLYSKAIDRPEFSNHQIADISIFIYTDKEKASVGNLWIGMLQKDQNELEPKIQISDVQLKSLTDKPEEKFRLTEDQRKEIYYQMSVIEKKASDEADRQFPLVDNKGISLSVSQEYLQKNTDLNDQNCKEYKADLISRSLLSDKSTRVGDLGNLQLDSIDLLLNFGLSTPYPSNRVACGCFFSVCFVRHCRSVFSIRSDSLL